MKLILGDDEFPVVRVGTDDMRNSDIAALQRETGWRMGKILEMATLELVSLQLAIFFTLRKNGRIISFARAGELTDEARMEIEPGDIAAIRATLAQPGLPDDIRRELTAELTACGVEDVEDEADPTPAGSAPAAEPATPTPARKSRPRTGSKNPSTGAS